MRAVAAMAALAALLPAAAMAQFGGSNPVTEVSIKTPDGGPFRVTVEELRDGGNIGVRVLNAMPMELPDGGLPVRVQNTVPITGSVGLTGPVDVVVPPGGLPVFLQSPSTVPISGSVGVLGTVPVSGSVSASITGTPTVAVSGTVPVSGSVNATLSGTPTVSISGTVPVSGSVNATLAGTPTVAIQGTVPVSGSVTANVPSPLTIQGTVALDTATRNALSNQVCTFGNAGRVSVGSTAVTLPLSLGDGTYPALPGRAEILVAVRPGGSGFVALMPATSDGGVPSCSTPGDGIELAPGGNTILKASAANRVRAVSCTAAGVAGGTQTVTYLESTCTAQ